MSLIVSLKEMQEKQFLPATGECVLSPTYLSVLFLSSILWLLNLNNTWLTPESYNSNSHIFPKSTPRLWEMSLGTSLFQGGKRKKKATKTPKPLAWGDGGAGFSSQILSAVSMGPVLLTPYTYHSSPNDHFQTEQQNVIFRFNFRFIFSLQMYQQRNFSPCSLGLKRKPSNKYF